MFCEGVVDLDRPVYVHPTNAFQLPPSYQDHPELLWALWGWTPETATHVLRLIFCGVFDRFPTAQVIVGHGGETLPYLRSRFDSRYQWNFPGLGPEKLPAQYLRENVLITTAGLFATPPLRCALKELGEGRVLVSVDYPYESGKGAGDWLDAAPLPADTLAKVATANAERALHL